MKHAHPRTPEALSARRSALNLALAAVLVAISIGWLAVWNPTAPHRPGYAEARAGAPSPPALVQRVVYVMVDGLRQDVSEAMPCVQALRARGATARALAGLPSVSQPGWITLVTGAPPELTGSGLMNVPEQSLQPIAVDHLFAAAKRAGLTTAMSVSGGMWWQKLIPPQYVDHAHALPAWDAAADRAAAEGVAPLLRATPANLILVYFAGYDGAAHDYGALSTEARQTAAAIDEGICLLAGAVDPASTVVIVTSDHGHRDAGGHGGPEPAVLETPFVMAGPRVRVGQYAPVRNVDIVPTIAALLGAELPRSSQGRILYEMLDVAPGERARGDAALAAQQLALAEAYGPAIGAPPLPDALRAGMAPVEVALAAGNDPEASRLAQALQAGVGAYVAQERAAAVARSRLLALPPLLAALAVLGYAFAANWRAGNGLPPLLALLGTLAFHAFYLARGHAYSASTMIGEEYLAITVGGATALAAGGSLLLLALARWLRPAYEPFLPALSALALGLAAWPFLMALAANALNGRVGSWNLIDPLWHFLLIFSLVQCAVTGLFALAAAGVYAALAAVRRGRGV